MTTLIIGNNNFLDNQKALNKFLVENKELEELSAELSTFNIFKVLNIENAEIRHSNVIAWLLNPHESHGFGETFIKRFISTILLKSEDPPLQPADVELMNMADVEVLREWNNFDLLAKSPHNEWVLLIENKIKSGSTQHQLEKYIERLKNEKSFKNFKHFIPILLTLSLDEGEDNAEGAGFIHWSHAQTYHVLNQVFKQKQKNMSLEAKVFIQHYLVILGRLTMQDERLIELCKSIYKKHKDAIDLIDQFGKTSQFRIAAESFMKDHDDLTEAVYRPLSVYFILKKWKMPNCIERWVLPYPVICWFNHWQNASKIGFVLEIGPWDDFKKRQSLIKALQNKEFKVGNKSFKEESKYTRFYSSYVKIDKENDPDSMKKHIEELWLKSQDHLNSTSEVIESFKW